MEKFKLLVGALYIAAFVSGSLLTNLIYHHNSKPIKPLGNDAPPIVDDIGDKRGKDGANNYTGNPFCGMKKIFCKAMAYLISCIICGIICGVLLGMIGSEIG